jgi:hypothetical protein
MKILLVELKKIANRCVAISVSLFEPIFKHPGTIFGIGFTMIFGLWGVLQGINDRGAGLQAVLKCEKIRYTESVDGKQTDVNLMDLLKAHDEVVSLQRIIAENYKPERLTAQQKIEIEADYEIMMKRLSEITVTARMNAKFKNLSKVGTTLVSGKVDFVSSIPSEDIDLSQFNHIEDQHALKFDELNIQIDPARVVDHSFDVSFKGFTEALFWSEWALRILRDSPDQSRAKKLLKSMAEIKALSSGQVGLAIRAISEGKPPVLAHVELAGLFGEQLSLQTALPLQMAGDVKFQNISFIVKDPAASYSLLRLIAIGPVALLVLLLVSFSTVIWIRRKSMKLAFFQLLIGISAASLFLIGGSLFEEELLASVTPAEHINILPATLGAMPRWMNILLENNILGSHWMIIACGVISASIFVALYPKKQRYQWAFCALFPMLCLHDFFAYLIPNTAGQGNRFLLQVLSNLIGSVLHVVGLGLVIWIITSMGIKIKSIIKIRFFSELAQQE